MKIPALFSLLIMMSCNALAVGWNYSSSNDPMSSKPIVLASIESDNSLNLGYPYQGENRGRLLIRQHPKHGLDVILTISKGQLMCDNHRGCGALIRFDDGKAMRFNGGESADMDRTTMFVLERKRFIDSARKARQIKVQVTIYEAGEQVLEFSTNQLLDWKSKK